jgi:hypothetical protein
MTVAVGNKIVMSGSSEHGQSQVLTRGTAKAQGTAWAGAPATISPSSSSSDAESFRSGLQSLLASLSANGNGLIQEEPAADGIEAQAESASSGLLAKAALAASPNAEIPALTLLAARTLPSSPVAGATQLPMVSKQATLPAWLATSTAPPQIAADSRAKVSAIVASASTAPSNRATSSEHAPKQKTAPVVGQTPLVYATGGNVPQAIVPAQSPGGLIETATLTAPSFPVANLAVVPPASSQLDSLNQNSPRAAYQAETAVSSSPTGIQAPSAVSEPTVAHAVQPAGFNEAPRSATEVSGRVPEMVSGSPDVSPAPSGDIHLSPEKTTEAASDDGIPQPDVATAPRELIQASSVGPISSAVAAGKVTVHALGAAGSATAAGELNQAIPIDSFGSPVATVKATDHALSSDAPATAGSSYSRFRSSTAEPAIASNQVLVGPGSTAPPAKTSLNISPGPSAPAHPAIASQPPMPTNLPPSIDTASPTTGDPVKSTESSPQVRIPTQQRSSGQEAETVAPPIAADWLGQTSAVQLAAAPLQPAQIAPTPPVVAKADVSTSVAAQSGIRSQRTIRGVSTPSQGNSQANGQIAGQSTESNPQVRGLPVATAPTSVTGGAVAGSAGSAASPAPHETFAALDGEAPNASPTWTHAGTQQAEAGFHDPALGWIGVRADSASGVVHASLVPDSADSALTLGGHVAGLNTYLAEQHSPVESLTVAAPESRTLSSGMGQSGMDQSGSQGMHQGTGQDSGQGSYSQAPSHTQQNTPGATEAASSIDTAPAGMQEPSTSAVVSGGRHISVMA